MQLYDPLSVLQGLEEAAGEAEEAPGQQAAVAEERGVFQLWEGMLLLQSGGAPVAACMYALERKSRLQQLAKMGSSLRVKGRCKAVDILDYFRKNQSVRVQVRGWLQLEAPEARAYHAELAASNKMGAIKLDSTNIYLFPWTDQAPAELKRAWFNFAGSPPQPCFGVLISHKHTLLHRPLEPITLLALDEDEYALREALARGGGDKPEERIAQEPPAPEAAPSSDDESLLSVPEVAPTGAPQGGAAPQPSVAEIREAIQGRLNGQEESLEEVRQLLAGLQETLPAEQLEELMAGLSEQDKAMLLAQPVEAIPEASPPPQEPPMDDEVRAYLET